MDRSNQVLDEPGHDKLLSRGEAAALLGISMSQFKRREARGKYTPTYIDPNGWHFFSTEYLSKLQGYGQIKNPRQRATAAQNVAEYRNSLFRTDSNSKSGTPNLYYEPQIAAKVFEAFDNNLNAGEIVKQFLIHPDVVTTIYQAWLRLKTMQGGGIQLSAKTLDIINNELGCLPGTYPVTTEAQLLANLREAARDVPMCNSCKTQTCRLCHPCAQSLYATEEEVAPQRTVTKQPRPRKSA